MSQISAVPRHCIAGQSTPSEPRTEDHVTPLAPDPATTFEPYRRHLTGLAYRMIGSLTDAEDIVQNTYLRWHKVDRAAVTDVRSYLSKAVARLCLDHLKSARVRREAYVGTWLPEPVLDSAAHAADSASEYANDLSFGFLLTLERLSPLERAAFLLHDVFGLSFDEIGHVLDRPAAACRQLAVRARAHLRDAGRRLAPSEAESARLLGAFQQAMVTGDVAGFAQLLADDAILYSDGGGKRAAALNPIYGRDKIVRFVVGTFGKTGLPPPERVMRVSVNGMPGLVLIDPGGSPETIALEIGNNGVAAIYAVRNPDKLRHVEVAVSGATPGD